jgi:hypothetical protein
MSARQLRARVDRLTLSARTAVGQDRNGAHGFTIDPTLAKALRNDQQRLSELNPRGAVQPIRKMRAQDLKVLHNRRAGNWGKAKVRKTTPVFR